MTDESRDEALRQTPSNRLEAVARCCVVALLEFVDRRRARLPLRRRVELPLGRFSLTSFRPRFQAAHEPYVRYLVAALRDRSDTGPRNIALSAGYGLGKSSVLRGVVRAFPRRVVHVTLGTLKRGVGASPASGEAKDSAAEVRSVQQEVVKQLLYSATQAKLSRSRFRRLDRFRVRVALPIVIPVVGIALGVLYNNQLVERLEQLIEDLGVPLWIAYVVAWAALSFAFVVVVRALGVVVRVGKVTAGSTSIELTGDDKGADYFDRYLDEMVYFFQETHRDIVIFEDIDRFGNAEVFEELRELNTLLNQADQIRRRPIRFVYSVRDSLFDEWPADSDSRLPLSLRRATQRMKFFDLVVPMVPTITHRTARDVFARFREAYPEETLSEQLVQEVAHHVPDMRVLAGILNEFKVFRSLTTGDDRPDLDSDESFAVLVYKVHESADFELLQFNESKLDRLFDHAQSIAQARSGEISKLLRGWNSSAEAVKTEDQLAQAANRRLLAAIGDQLAYSGVELPFTWSFDGAKQPANAPETPGFWKTLLGSTMTSVQIANSSSGLGWTVPVERLLAFARVSVETWGESAMRESRQRRELLLEEQRMFSRATWAELYPRTDLAFKGETFAQRVHAEFSDPIVPRLIELGYLTDGYYLHAAVFYGRYLGKRATTFLDKYVNRRQVAMDFVLDKPEDALALVEQIGEGFLGEQDSALNVSLTDIVIKAGQAEPLFERYASPSELEIEFAESYLRSGGHLEPFLKGVASRWPAAFAFAVRADVESRLGIPERLEAVLAASDPSVAYRVGADQLESLREQIQQLEMLRNEITPSEADRFASVLDGLGVEIVDLSAVAAPLQVAIETTGQFAVTFENLALIGGGKVSLDDFLDKEAVLKRIEADIEEYLRVIKTHSVVSVGDPASFEAVMARFQSVEPQALEELASRAAVGARLPLLEKLATSAWAPVIRAGRVLPTMKIVDGYLGEFGVDETILPLLAGASSLDPADAAQASRRDFAIKLLSADDVPVVDRVRLVGSLRLDDYLDTDEIGIDNEVLPGALLREEIIADNEDTILWAQAAGFPALRSLLKVSTKFADEVVNITLNGEEIAQAFDPAQDIPDPVLTAIHANLTIFEANMTKVAWRRYANWAARKGATISDATLIAMPGNGATPVDVIEILNSSFPSRTPAVIAQVLANIGGEYARLTAIGPGSETFDKSERMAKLADLLSKRGLSRSWRHTITGRVQIYRRHK